MAFSFSNLFDHFGFIFLISVLQGKWNGIYIKKSFEVVAHETMFLLRCGKK